MILSKKSMGYKMDKKVVEFIKGYNITDLELEDIKMISPMLELTSYKEFLKNCKILSNYGYSKEDLDLLILANPNIFVKSARDLEGDLIKLKNKYDDIETILKKNPTII